MFATKHAHLIAEIGVNHEGSLDRARKLIEAAWRGGASSVKLQHYRPETLASPEARSYWDTDNEPETSQSELFSRGYEFDHDQLANLREFCRSLPGLSFTVSVFDHREVESLMPLVDYFKVASGDITYRPLIENVAASGKPVVLSTGGSLIDEVREAVLWAQEAGVSELVILQCTLSYPTKIGDANLETIRLLKSNFPNATIGVSDHIPSEDLSRFSMALALGSRVFEKHFSDHPGDPGNDYYHSFGESQFKNLSRQMKLNAEMLGAGQFMLKAEEAAREGARRSCFYRHAFKSGHPISDGDIVFLRPGNGLPPKAAFGFRGRILSTDVGAQVRVSEEDFK